MPTPRRVIPRRPARFTTRPILPYYLRIREDGTGLHAGYLPGYRASHGCIRLPHAFAELLFSNVSEGTPVDVVP